MSWTPGDELDHNVAAEEWTFSCWESDGSLGLITGYRLIGDRRAWYWWALARRGEPLLHVTEFDIPRRSNPLLAKAESMWAELTCEAPFEQWTIGNETYAVALDDPDEALGRVYGLATPIAMDLEWYATESAADTIERDPNPDADRDPNRDCEVGYEQRGVAHGQIELAGGVVELVELPAHRTHRWTNGTLRPTTAAGAFAHLGLRAPFRLPDASELDVVLTAQGWRSRSNG